MGHGVYFDWDVAPNETRDVKKCCFRPQDVKCECDFCGLCVNNNVDWYTCKCKWIDCGTKKKFEDVKGYRIEVEKLVKEKARKKWEKIKEILKEELQKVDAQYTCECSERERRSIYSHGREKSRPILETRAHECKKKCELIKRLFAEVMTKNGYDSESSLIPEYTLAYCRIAEHHTCELKLKGAGER